MMGDILIFIPPLAFVIFLFVTGGSRNDEMAIPFWATFTVIAMMLITIMVRS
jgi:hypothetical protein